MEPWEQALADLRKFIRTDLDRTTKDVTDRVRHDINNELTIIYAQLQEMLEELHKAIQYLVAQHPPAGMALHMTVPVTPPTPPTPPAAPRSKFHQYLYAMLMGAAMGALSFLGSAVTTGLTSTAAIKAMILGAVGMGLSRGLGALVNKMQQDSQP